MNSFDILEYQPYIKYIIKRHFKQYTDDLVQEANVAILKAMPKYNKEKGDVRTFLYKVVMNAIYQNHRNNKRFDELDFVTFDDEAGVSVLTEDHHKPEFVWKGVKTTDRMILEMYFGFRGAPKNQVEIAKMLNCAKQAVNFKFQRGLDKLRSNMLCYTRP